MRKIRVLAGWVLALFVVWLSGCGKEEKPKVHVAIPYSEYVQDYESNYYITWLRERTGMDIEITVIRNTRSEVYLKELFDAGSDIDVIFFGRDFSIEEDAVRKILPQNLELSDYCYPSNAGISRSSECGQVLWMNKQWLLELGLSVPETTGELEKVLMAFREKDPNGNGEKDEIPVVGSMESYEKNPLYYMLNSYVYTDPYHSFYYKQDKEQLFAPVTDAFREGLTYINQLYDRNAIDEYAFSCTGEQIAELVNSPDDLVGAFTTANVSDVIYPDNPEILARFIHVPPAASPVSGGHALYRECRSSVGAVINYNTGRYDAAKKLMDVMMSEEASLIARYGEEGADWEYAKDWEVGIYGAKATITTLNYIWNTRQNKHLAGIGPMKVPEKYLSGVTWNGVNSDMEYMEARAAMSYENFFPKEIPDVSGNREIVSLVEKQMVSFVKGVFDVHDKKTWEDFCGDFAESVDD